MSIPIVVSTSNKYHHCLRVFIYLFNKNWSDKQYVEIVGYEHPPFELPKNFTFHSMGEQGSDPSCFSGDLRRYFEYQGENIIWLFEDSFIKSVDFEKLKFLESLTKEDMVGRIDLGDQCLRGPFYDYHIKEVKRYEVDRPYRLSTQPSIWNLKYLLSYLKPGLSPWDLERLHPISDGWDILGIDGGCLKYNEGVTKKDIHAFDLNGIPEEQIDEMKQLGIL